MERNRKLLTLIIEFSKAIRVCQQEAMFDGNITFLQFYILDLIAGKESMRLSELHKVLFVEKSTTTRLVDPLLKQELIVREKLREDSRAIELKLTEKGERVLTKAWDQLAGFLNSVEMQIPEEKRKEVYQAVRMFLMALRNCCAVGRECCSTTQNGE